MTSPLRAAARDAVRERYAKRLDKIIDRADALNEREIRTILRDLDAARKEVADILQDQPTDWTIQHYNGIMDRIAMTMRGLRERLAENLTETQQERHQQGAEATDDLVVGVGKEPPLRRPQPLAPEMLQTLESFGVDLVTNLSDDVLKKIGTTLKLGIAANKNPFEVMQEIGRQLKNPDGTPAPGIWGDVMTRAEVIHRTESNRVHGLAQQQRLEQWSKDRPGVLKTWKAALDSRTRPAHARAGRDYMPGGNPGPIPVDEPFILHEGGVEYPAMYPRDPRLPASLSVFCRCTSGPYRKEWED